MVTVAEIGGAISGLKGALDLVKGVKAVSDGLTVQQVQMDLGQRILDAQSALNTALAAQTEATEKIRRLEQEIVSLKDWSTEAERYEPVNVYLGTIAYMLKVGMENGEPAHWLCPNCFQQKRKSFLAHKGQMTTKTGGRGMESKWACDSCGFSMMVSYRCHPDRSHEERVEAAKSGDAA